MVRGFKFSGTIGEFSREKVIIYDYVTQRKRDIKELKEAYKKHREIKGSKMEHYVVVGGKIFNGFGLEEAKKIVSVCGVEEKQNGK